MTIITIRMTSIMIMSSVDIPCNVLQTNRSSVILGAAKPHNLHLNTKKKQDSCEVDLNENFQ